MFTCPSPLDKSDAYRGMKAFQASQHHPATKIQWPSLSGLPSCVPGNLLDQPRASELSNEGTPRGCRPIAWLPESWGSGKH